MNYTLRLRCASCGHDVKHRTNGTTDGLMTRAIGDCVNCGLEHRVTVCLQAVDPSARGVSYQERKPPEAVVCGMASMYRRGCRCDQCRAAHNRDVKDRRQRKVNA